MLPVAYYPDYSKHVKNGDKNDPFVVDFSYEVRVLSETGIVNVSIPKHAEIVEQDKLSLSVRCMRRSRSIELYYMTVDMVRP